MPGALSAKHVHAVIADIDVACHYFNFQTLILNTNRANMTNNSGQKVVENNFKFRVKNEFRNMHDIEICL